MGARICKGRFTRYDFVAYDKLTTGLRHELSRVNQTYSSLNGPKSCRRPVVSLSYATKSYRVNRPYNSNWTEWSTIQGVIARGRFGITSTITPFITYRAKLLNADWLRQRAFFLNHDLEGTFGNQERA